MSRRRRKSKWTPEHGVVGSLDRRARAVVLAGEGGRPREARVEGALPKETVEFLRYDREGPVDVARTLAVSDPAAERVEPRCQHYGVCGGCSLMHLDPAAQIAWKESLLLADLAAHGLSPARTLPPLRAEEWRYRRRARLGAKLVPGKGKVVVGFREKDRRFIADLSTCEVLAGPTCGPLADQPGRLIPLLGELIGSLSIAAKLPQVEISVGDAELALVMRTLEPPSEADLERLRSFARAHELRIFLQPKGLDSVAPLEPEQGELLHFGLPAFEVELGFRPTDFVQVNAAINRAMVERAVELLELEPQHRTLDLFCGLGNFSLPLARRCAFVLGVEGDEGLVERARQNAIANGIGNVSFERRDLYGELAELDWLDGRFDRVLLDPPRSGAEALVERFDQIGAARVVYVACSPESLGRDAAILVGRHGYRLSAAGVMDMFPHTAHVESIAVFERS
ncbi:MAG: 23S rRNA (uracil(1939)-C(5))-methyltransferase RlmD [Enhygromyxa sp.]